MSTHNVWQPLEVSHERPLCDERDGLCRHFPLLRLTVEQVGRVEQEPQNQQLPDAQAAGLISTVDLMRAEAKNPMVSRLCEECGGLPTLSYPSSP